MTTVGILHIKNEARWIVRVLRAIKPLCSSIFVLDDHSTDRSALLCQEEGCTVIPSPFEGLNESRDVQFIYNQAMQVKPDWIVAVDGDEELERGGVEKIQAAITSAPTDVSAFKLRIVYLWDRVNQQRVDGVYGNYHRRRVYRALPQLPFAGDGTGSNLHCGSIGHIKTPSGREVTLDVRLLHYGYLHKEDRIVKWKWHNQVEPNNIAEDCFRHIVQGDVPEVPADLRLRHAGPLVLKAL